MRRTSIIIISFIIVLLMAGLFSFFKKKTVDTQATKASNVSAENFVARLEELDYFKYADQKDIDTLRQNMVEGFDPTNELVSVWDDNTGIPKDYRYYFCDGEDLYEEGGFTDMLKTLKPTFDKISFNLTINDHHEVWDNNNQWLDHTITINGTKYTIFRHFKEAGWGEAAQRFSEILNSELEKQNKDERIYLVSGGNDGRLIFLTEQQFNFIDSVYSNEKWKPLKVKDWCRAMGVNHMSVD